MDYQDLGEKMEMEDSQVFGLFNLFHWFFNINTSDNYKHVRDDFAQLEAHLPANLSKVIEKLLGFDSLSKQNVIIQRPFNE